MNAPIRPTLAAGVRSTQRRLLRNNDTLAFWLQGIADAVVTLGLLLILTHAQLGSVPVEYRHLGATSILLMLMVYRRHGVYRRFMGKIEGAKRLARAWSTVIMALTVITFATKTSEIFSRQVILGWAVLAFVAQFWMHYLTFTCLRSLQKRSAGIPTLVIGTGDLARHLVASLHKNPWIPDRVLGVLSEHGGDQSHWTLDAVPVVGTTGEMKERIRELGIRRVYVALPLRLTHHVERIQEELLAQNVDVIWAPDIHSLRLLNHSVRELNGVPLLSLSETPLASEGQAFIKAAMDRTLAVLALLVFSPIMLATAVAIKLTSRGPVLFKQLRHGWDGRLIEVYKFRSMRVHQEQAGTVTQARQQDARITPVGRFIRRTSIDELPQLFNVLGGSMSLVGPRPHAVAHNEFYGTQVDAYLSRHRIKPGMTGLAQIRGLRGETDTVDKMEARVRADLEYINNWSPWLDLKIMVLTPLRLFSRNAY